MTRHQQHSSFTNADVWNRRMTINCSKNLGILESFALSFALILVVINFSPTLPRSTIGPGVVGTGQVRSNLPVATASEK
jgi:hypothetical protein